MYQTPRRSILLEKLMLSELVEHYRTDNIPCTTHNLPLSVPFLTQINSIHVPNPIALRYILILSSRLGLGLPNGLFLSDFSIRNLYSFLHTPMRAIFPTHLILLDLITRTIFGKEYRTLSSSLCNFIHSPVTSSILGQNIFLSTLL